MPLFYYEALDPDGKRIQGTVDAISAQAARAALRQDHLEAEELHEATLDERKKFEGYIPTPQTKTPPPQKTVPAPVKTEKKYYPFVDTLRLYAGWLLAWYCLVYAIGAYQNTKETFTNIPYVEGLLPPYSSIVFSFTIASFLFLLLTTIHKILGGTPVRNLGLFLLGIAIFSLYRINV